MVGLKEHSIPLYYQLENILREKIKSGDLAESIALFKKYHTSQSYGGSIDVWSADTRFVIDWLEKTNNKDTRSPFYRRLKMNKLGVFGMSFGGATASQIVFRILV